MNPGCPVLPKGAPKHPDTGCFVSVSYTHLDVYKRQIISKRYIFPDKVEKLRAFLGEKIEEYHIPKLLTEEEMEGLHLATEDRSAR